MHISIINLLKNLHFELLSSLGLRRVHQDWLCKVIILSLKYLVCLPRPWRVKWKLGSISEGHRRKFCFSLEIWSKFIPAFAIFIPRSLDWYSASPALQYWDNIWPLSLDKNNYRFQWFQPSFERISAILIHDIRTILQDNFRGLVHQLLQADFLIYKIEMLSCLSKYIDCNAQAFFAKC